MQEQDALDAFVLLTAAITEQLQTGRFAPHVASRMGALLMVVREYVLPPPAAGAGRDRPARQGPRGNGGGGAVGVPVRGATASGHGATRVEAGRKRADDEPVHGVT